MSSNGTNNKIEKIISDKSYILPDGVDNYVRKEILPSIKRYRSRIEVEKPDNQITDKEDIWLQNL